MPTAICDTRRDTEQSYVLVNVSDPVENIIDPETLTYTYDHRGRARGLLYQRERAYAVCAAYKFQDWLTALAARDGIPLDMCLGSDESPGTIIILRLYVECFLTAAATWPELFADQEVEDSDDEPDYWTPRTADEANAEGLAIVRKGKSRRPVPTLPGCHGHDANGAKCQELRFYGSKFCPRCETAERARLRAAE